MVQTGTVSADTLSVLFASSYSAARFTSELGQDEGGAGK
jgi:hypothetical protein